MEQLVVNAKVRTVSGKGAAGRIRKSGRIPAVMYDAKGKATMLDVDEVEFNKVWRAITKTTLITLAVEGQEPHDAFIKDTEYNIISDKVLHADFFTPDAHQKINAKLKVRYEGTPAGVLKGGFMIKHLPEIKIVAEPKHVPAKVVADISGINIGEVYRVKDLKLGEGVTIVTDGESPLVSIAAPR